VLLISAVTLVLGVTLAERLELLTSMVNFGALTGSWRWSRMNQLFRRTVAAFLVALGTWCGIVNMSV
jgi:hypothetical protein